MRVVITELRHKGDLWEERTPLLIGITSSGQVRAHALLKSKDAELRVAKESAEAAAASSIDEARSALKAAEEKVLQVSERA